MEGSPREARWRVGHISDPLGFVPSDRCSWNHRFDDPRRRFRTLYCALRPETALREVLADLRPNAAQLADYAHLFGADALADLPKQAITAAWRAQHVLVECRIDAEAKIVDLTDPAVREEIARDQAGLLADHGMPHLDLTEITVRRRAVTQQIAGYAHDELGAAVIRFPSNLDGLPCYALFEHRARLTALAPAVPLTDPAPEALENVAAGWRMSLEPARRAARSSAQRGTVD